MTIQTQIDPVQSEIMDLMADGRERTIADIAHRVRLKPKEAGLLEHRRNPRRPAGHGICRGRDTGGDVGVGGVTPEQRKQVDEAKVRLKQAMADMVREGIPSAAVYAAIKELVQ